MKPKHLGPFIEAFLFGTLVAAILGIWHPQMIPVALMLSVLANMALLRLHQQHPRQRL